MNEQAKVSIVINNCDYGRFVGQAIDSALGQTYRNVEVIVVDDGSTDNSRQVIESRGDRIRTIFKENGGQASAINAGFAVSTGDLILFLDSDDLLNANAIETVVNEWRQGVARINFPLHIINANGEDQGSLLGGTELPSPLQGSFGVGSPTSGNVFSRAALEKIMPAPEVAWRTWPDFYLVTAGLFGEVMSLRQPLGKYRVHGNNRSWCGDPLEVLRNRLRLDLRLYAALFRLTDGKIAPLEEWLGSCPQHWVGRITSMREKPEDHPWPDKLARLTARAIMATWRQPGRNFRRRLALTLLAVGHGILPRKATRTLREIERRNPGRAFRRLLGGCNPVGAGNDGERCPVSNRGALERG